MDRYGPSRAGGCAAKDYLTVTQDPEERFLTSHYIVDSYAMMRAHDEAVEHHRRYLAELGSEVPAWRRLWSLSAGTMAGSWRMSGKTDEYLSLTETLRLG